MNASSESGECASLISTGAVSVFEAACWPGMGWWFLFSQLRLLPEPFLLQIARSGMPCDPARIASPGPKFSDSSPLAGGPPSEDEWKDTCVAGACVTQGPGNF